ncbi:hypothetical protein LARI1_G008321 [Lachnellula arida]|uniref:Uncharacterized protein n=1 Tax=Lachnellula arida TaxID=1316785 RepID=A0A8T9B7I2_9HELO|nr:hypothetical protein LARI1_G008321 [Lachnellula arida]
MTSRKSSDTMIIPRETIEVELVRGDEVFDEHDARAMSPRRSEQDLEKIYQDTWAQFDEHAKNSRQFRQKILDCLQASKKEYDKLEKNNKLLQKDIGDLKAE